MTLACEPAGICAMVAGKRGSYRDSCASIERRKRRVPLDDNLERRLIKRVAVKLEKAISRSAIIECSEATAFAQLSSDVRCCGSRDVSMIEPLPSHRST